MKLPELPFEQQIAIWLQTFRRDAKRYLSTVWRALHFPTSLVRHFLYDQEETKAQTAPLPFALYSLFFASLIYDLAMITLGVDKPFFEDLNYYSHFLVAQHLLTSIQTTLPVGFTVPIILQSIEFTIVLMVIVFWARTVIGYTFKYSKDVAALSYLLPLSLIAVIIKYCAMNLTFRIFDGQVLQFAGSAILIMILPSFILYSIVWRIVDQVYSARGWRRVFHATGYVIVGPILLFIIYLAFNLSPLGIYAYRVINPTVEGIQTLDTGDYDAAEKLFVKAIENDPVEILSSVAHIRLVSVNAKRILALLPEITSSSGMHDRLFRRFVQKDPYRRVMDVWRSEGPINFTPKQLVELREAILDSFLISRDIPVTNSELDRAMLPEVVEGHHILFKEAVKKYANSPSLAQRQRLYYLLFRSRALEGEPTKSDARRYLQFLNHLPVRIELLFVRYHALNLMRDSKTLATLDVKDRSGTLDRGYLIKGNKEIMEKGLKFPYLWTIDAELDKLSDQEFGFRIRQLYLNYLQAEARLLAASPINSESSLIKQKVESIKKELNWVSNDRMYRDIPPVNHLEQAILKKFEMKSEVVNTGKDQ